MKFGKGIHKNNFQVNLILICISQGNLWSLNGSSLWLRWEN